MQLHGSEEPSPRRHRDARTSHRLLPLPNDLVDPIDVSSPPAHSTSSRSSRRAHGPGTRRTIRRVDPALVSRETRRLTVCAPMWGSPCRPRLGAWCRPMRPDARRSLPLGHAHQPGELAGRTMPTGRRTPAGRKARPQRRIRTPRKLGEQPLGSAPHRESVPRETKAPIRPDPDGTGHAAHEHRPPVAGVDTSTTTRTPGDRYPMAHPCREVAPGVRQGLLLTATCTALHQGCRRTAGRAVLRVRRPCGDQAHSPGAHKHRASDKHRASELADAGHGDSSRPLRHPYCWTVSGLGPAGARPGNSPSRTPPQPLPGEGTARRTVPQPISTGRRFP